MKTILKNIAKVLRRERGFTLVEMVTVVAIMGVMAAVAVPMVTSQLGKAREGSYDQDKQLIQTAVDSYYTDANNARFLGQRQFPILGSNSGADNTATGGEDRSTEVVDTWLADDSHTALPTPLNVYRGTRGGEPKWMDGLDGDQNRNDEDNLNAELETIVSTASGWHVSNLLFQATPYAVDSRDYFIDFRELVSKGYLQTVPESASFDNGGGAGTGSYSWYVKATGQVESLFFHFPTNGTSYDGTYVASEDLRGFFIGVYP